MFTDLHIVEEGGEIIGLDPGARFSEGLSHALTHHGDADGIILMGDLTHHGRTSQFERLYGLLKDVPLPITYMLGNHDNRDVFRRVFPEADVTSDGHVQRMQEFAGCVLITLDTMDLQVKPRHSGVLCPSRLAWLERALVWAAGRPVVVAMHHPPVMTGFAGMDRIALQNPEPLLDMLRSYGGPLHLLCGHVHRTISGFAEGVPFTIFKSPCHQQPMPFDGAGSANSVDEPGAYGIVLAGESGIIAHSEDFAIAAATTPSRDTASR
ncbi:MAG: phosphodiesterase [Litoreibacter sp.]|nr:phosphodiesterase [Litoreibacter sp.]